MSSIWSADPGGARATPRGARRATRGSPPPQPRRRPARPPGPPPAPRLAPTTTTVTASPTAANPEAPMKYAALVLVAATAATGHAQPSGAQAETLFRQGKDLLAKGKIAEACAAFDASQKLDPTIATLLNQAACREKNEQFATAWGLFLEAERQTRSATDTATQQLHQVAASKAAKLEPRLSTLTINAPAENRVGGLQVTRAGDVVDPGAWNKALPVDGGTYRIAASAPGNAEWSTTLTIGNEHDVKAIEIPKLKAAALEPPRPKPPDRK